MSAEQAIEIFFALLHGVAAVAVTCHVLLNKRDVAAAVGWIGLAWLSPVFGAGFYFLLGINRVRRRARRLQRHPGRRRQAHQAGGTATALGLAPRAGFGSLEVLELAGRRITGRATEDGNSVAVLVQGDEAYPEMLSAIAAARSSIALSTYIFRGDAVGRAFIAALAEAHRRGVQVRVLVDGIGAGYFYSPAYRLLRRQGIPAAQFLHSELPWRMPFLNMRSHKKILVIDGRRAFTGGLNIGAENVLATAPRHPVRDTHFQVVGPVVAQIVEAFAEDWQFTMGETLAGPAWFPSLEDAGAVTVRAITSGPDQDIEKLEFVLMTAINTARSSIKIVTPYFLPDERLSSALALAALRGIEVDIAIPEIGNHRVVDWATRAHIRPLLVAGCRLWHAPPPFDHSKLMTVDAAWSLVGSANWDLRSLRLNFEMNLEIYHTAFAAQLGEVIQGKFGRRVTIADLDRRPLAGRLRDAAARLLLPYL
ncbi:MAG TPA: phospholipase D-like domain-containing protein [Stellaceae bacterium]|nr:phospholipase D-like domain-containing protein [Stellaceae bacterium]